MVFDGADTIEAEEASGYIDIKHFIPSASTLMQQRRISLS
jgi:hypothetical protein